MRRLLLVSAVVAGCSFAVPATASAVTVYAAASLREALPQFDKDAKYSFGGSNTLQAQIERGAPADLFLAASPTEPQALFRAGRCTRPVTYATNRLVLLVPKSNPGNVRSIYSLRSGGRRLSIGTAGVPIGAYTRKLLRRMRLTKILSSNRVSTESNVADITSKVALGSADAGFTYVTDARVASDRVRAIRLPRWAQPPVRYLGCVVQRSGADTSAAQAYLNRLRGDAGRALLKSNGFGLPPKG